MNVWRRIRRAFEPTITSVSAYATNGTASVVIVNGRVVQVSTETRCPRCGSTCKTSDANEDEQEKLQ